MSVDLSTLGPTTPGHVIPGHEQGISKVNGAESGTPRDSDPDSLEDMASPARDHGADGDQMCRCPPLPNVYGGRIASSPAACNLGQAASRPRLPGQGRLASRR